MNTWLAALVGALTGILSGFGIGGGSLLLLYLTMVVHLDQYTAGGINLLYFLSCAPSALWIHGRNGLVEKRVVLWSLWGVLACALAAWLASVIQTDLLRRLFGVLLLGIGLREVFAKKQKEA